MDLLPSTTIGFSEKGRALVDPSTYANRRIICRVSRSVPYSTQPVHIILDNYLNVLVDGLETPPIYFEISIAPSSNKVLNFLTKVNPSLLVNSLFDTFNAGRQTLQDETRCMYLIRENIMNRLYFIFEMDDDLIDFRDRNGDEQDILISSEQLQAEFKND